MCVRNGSDVDCPGSWSWSWSWPRSCSWSCSGVMCVRNGSGVDCPGSGRVHRQRLGRWCLLHHPPTHAFRAVCTTSPLVLLCHKYASVLLCATSKYAAHCASSHLSPPSPSPRTFRRPRGRRPGSARGLLQRPGKLLEIQTSLDLFQRKDETQ